MNQKDPLLFKTGHQTFLQVLNDFSGIHTTLCDNKRNEDHSTGTTAIDSFSDGYIVTNLFS